MGSRGFLPNERNITAAFVPSARTNLEAVSQWIYGVLSALDHLRAHTLDSDRVVPRSLELSFDERLEGLFVLDPFG